MPVKKGQECILPFLFFASVARNNKISQSHRLLRNDTLMSCRDAIFFITLKLLFF